MRKQLIKIVTATLLITSLATNYKTVNADTKEKHRIIEVKTHCIESTHKEDKNNPNIHFENGLETQDKEIIMIDSEESMLDKEFVLIIDDKGTENIEDDEILEIYNLENYLFE